MKRSRVRGIVFSLVGAIIALCACLCLAACGGEKSKPPQAVSESSIRYDGTKFSWDRADNASKYVLVIGENERTTNNNLFGYNCGDAESVTVTITAVNDAGSSDAVTRTFTRLATVESLDFDAAGVMSWNTVDGASGYEVEVNGKTVNVDTTTFDGFTYGARNTVRVRPVGGDDCFSFWSDAVSKEYMGAPTDIDYDGLDIVWRGYNNASGYTVYINNSLYGTSKTPSLRYDSNRMDFTVSVVSNGDGKDSFDSEPSATQEYSYLGAAENLRVADGILIWDEVEKATCYKITVNGITTDISENEFALTENVTQTVRVQPTAANTSGVRYFSEWSEEKTFKVLRRPVLQWNPSASMDGNVINSLYWSTIGDSDGYRIRLTDPSGTVADAGDRARENPSFGHAYNAVGRYVVEVKSLAPLGGDTCDSRWSEPMTVERLPAPNAGAIPVTSDANDLAKGFTVHFAPVSGATGYRLYRENVSVGTDARAGATSLTVTDIVGDAVTEAQHVAYELQSLGSNKVLAGESRVTLDSLLSSGGNSSPRTFDITILAMPTSVDIQGYNVSWDRVNGADGYAVKTRGSNPDVALNSAWDLKNITTAGPCTMEICARGNGAETLPSRYTAGIQLVKLDKPIDIRVNTNTDEGRITCRNVVNAQGYYAYFNGNNNDGDGFDTATFTGINQYIDTSIVTVVMQAVGNYWAADNSKYYITSELSEPKQFMQLAQVRDVRFVGNELVWNAPSNVSGSVAGIRYEVYAGDGRQYDAEFSAPRMNLNSFVGGQSYTFSIRCIGDGNTFLSSEPSEPKEVFKLATPDVRVAATRDKYEWAGVNRATKYAVGIEGELAQELTAGETQYKPVFAEYRTQYSITVTAVGDGSQTIDSTPAKLTQKLKRADAPSDVSVEYVSVAAEPDNYRDINGNYFVHSDGRVRVTVGSAVQNATGYLVTCGSARQVLSDATAYDFNATSVGNYGVSVTALGGVFVEDNGEDYYLYDSLAYNAGTIRVLSSTSAGDIKVNSSDYILWNGIAGVSDFELTVECNDGQTYKIKVVGTSSYALSQIGDGGIAYSDIASISVRSLGNGVTTVSSAAAVWRR